MKKQLAIFALFVAAVVGFWFVPWGRVPGPQAVRESLLLAQDYARHHVVLCLVPAFFIAGAIAVFVSEGAIIRYFGPAAPKPLAYGVASVSGTILAVCSCTVLPLFAGIRRMGAGLGPAIAFLYSGPAINVLAIILTARVLGLDFGIARAVGAIVFSVVIGLLMHLIFLRGERALPRPANVVLPDAEQPRPLWQTGLIFAAMVGVLVFANWGKPAESAGVWHAVHVAKWPITAGFAAALGVMLVLWMKLKWWHVLAAAGPAAGLAVAFPSAPELAFSAGVAGLAVVALLAGGEPRRWVAESWSFARQILPLLLIGVLAAGLLLGRPGGGEGLIPARWVASAVGGNSLAANLLASVLGAFMYFATLTEVPILEGLLGQGMGKGPALALLLAGPALSLPNMLVIRSVIGAARTAVYVLLVVVMSTIAGLIYGMM